MTSWGQAAAKIKNHAELSFIRPTFPLAEVDWNRIVTVDFETFYDTDYTLKKMSTSEYIRDPRFHAQMVGIKIGNKPTKVYAAKDLRKALLAINWKTHSLLCHNTQFDGFILSHHFGIVPAFYYDTLSMARGLHSNEIGAGLTDVAMYYGKGSKIEGALESVKGLRDWPKDVVKRMAEYCAQDVDLTFEIFKAMHAKYPADEIDLIHLTVKMFCDPVLRVDIPRVEKELKRELDAREKLFYSVVNPAPYYEDKTVLKTKAERALTGVERDMLVIKRVIGSNEKFADMLRAVGVDPPVKISPAWMKKPVAERDDADKWAYAFSKTDLDFINLPDNIDLWKGSWNPNKKADMAKILARQDVIRNMVECRLSVKSTTNITRAERFLTAGANGMPLPVGYAYFRAHTGRWGGNNKMNMQNLTRGGELRLSILAAAGYALCVADSGQIEARVNGWLWGQEDLLEAFRKADTWDKSKGVARGKDRDAYCQFADLVYDREITTNDKIERFVGKVCVLGLGFQMGAPKFQITLARGALGGPPVHFELDKCRDIVNKYRRKNNMIEKGWQICNRIIEEMAVGKPGQWKCISWEKGKLWLPNGMSLKYPDLRKAQNPSTGFDEWTYQSGDMRSKIYGGLLCENIVQALARIIVASQMLIMHRQGLRLVMTTHDEAVTHVKKASADRAFKIMEKAMKTPPGWCPDIPLNCEGGWAENYSK